MADEIQLKGTEAEVVDADGYVQEGVLTTFFRHFGNERGTAIAIVSIRHNLAVMGYRTGIQSRHLS